MRKDIWLAFLLVHSFVYLLNMYKINEINVTFFTYFSSFQNQTKVVILGEQAAAIAQSNLTPV